MLDHVYRDDNDVENPFNNKVLVIDEIHNLTSGMVGSGYNGRRLYEQNNACNKSKSYFFIRYSCY